MFKDTIIDTGKHLDLLSTEESSSSEESNNIKIVRIRKSQVLLIVTLIRLLR